ncbi:HFM1 (YGL251C) [Zygosaccharomyces parabailii]|nr:HFM1 (YGL251C) [Zygosaccharomyces parabailii]
MSGDEPEVPPLKRRRVLKKKPSKNNLSTKILPDLFGSIFTFDEFNKMQSEAFPELYENDENCVITSPTGSGKTVLFELAILRLIIKTGRKMGNVKILYFAPTKALCCERLKSWGPKFLNLTVGMLTSDTSFLEIEKVKSCNVIITTPEKWDLLTRKWYDHTCLFESVKLMLVDEIHTLREKRGATLEVVLTRMNIFCPSIRIIAVSATIPNIKDIARWLTSSDGNKTTKVLTFNDSYRQVALQKHVYAYSFHNKKEFYHDGMYNTKLNEIFRQHSKQRPVLIFCPTRSSTVSTAKYIVQHCAHYVTASDKVNQKQFSEQGLSGCYNKGVAFHHAGLSMQDRNLVENGFLEGKIKVLCSTSTLAVGVNLPAYLVIIKGTRVWNSSITQEYSQLDVLQMIGRAGRPMFENEGCAIIMTESKMKEVYEKMIYGTEELESSLHLEVTEHLSAEVSLGTITSTESAVNWLRKTFFYVRLKENPAAYDQVVKCSNRMGVKDSHLFQFCGTILQCLLNYHLVRRNNSGLVSTAYGYAMARHYVLFESMKNFLNATRSLSIREILCLLSKSGEFMNIRVRQNEKRLYKEINLSPLIKFPFLTEKMHSQIIDASSQKVSLLIQYELGGLDFPSYSGALKMYQALEQDKSLVFRSCFRIINCMIDVFVEKKDGISLRNTLFLLRSLNGSCWEDSAMVLRQLHSIGIASVKKLIQLDVRNLEQLASLSDQQIEYYLGQKMFKGAEIKKDLTLLPKIFLSCKPETYSYINEMIAITLKVELSAQFDTSIWHGQALSVDVETLKAKGELLDFRRIKLAHLSSAQSFKIDTTLDARQDYVEVNIHCLEVASIGKSVMFSSADLPPKLPESQPRDPTRTNALDNCLLYPLSDADMEESSMSSDDSLFEYLNERSAMVESNWRAAGK